MMSENDLDLDFPMDRNLGFWCRCGRDQRANGGGSLSWRRHDEDSAGAAKRRLTHLRHRICVDSAR
ncbi:hypothetical protein TIFTF001_012732 [Ficus carica]|uniref:Uncharacterized protein n=1 Tax=Ficus carica TaxID=3494 RepID=A0AA88D3Z0_FICCA|nr:hypothetical protein TIFTF001_012732 [Ficus carica]